MHSKGITTSLLLSLLLASITLPASSAIAQSNRTVNPTPNGPPAEQTLLQLANQSRAQHNLPPLRWDSALALAARNHLRWVLRNPGELRHQYPGEPDLVARGASAGARFGTISENIAGHGQTPADLHNIWMTSPVHRTNLLDPRLNVVGIAVVENHGLLFAVEDFARDVPALTPDSVQHQVAKLLHAQC